MSMELARERATKGAAFLDEHEPGWERKIDLTRFDMADSCRCVWGWVKGGGDRRQSDGWSLACMTYTAVDMEALGFETFPDSLVSFADLDEAWIELIEARLGVTLSH